MVGSRTSLQIGSGYCKRVEGIVTVTGLGSQGRDRQDRRHETSPRAALPPSLRCGDHRFSVWLYQVFSLSLRDVELLLAGALPTACAADGHGPGTSGTCTRCSSGSMACSTIFGAAWISTALCSTSSFRSAEMPKPPSASSGAC